MAQRQVFILYEVMGKEGLTPRYQYRDPLSGVLDYIVEVRPPGYNCSPRLYLAGQRNAVRMSLWLKISLPLPMTMTFKLSKAWYV
jgi:hypothetical protein